MSGQIADRSTKTLDIRKKLCYNQIIQRIQADHIDLQGYITVSDDDAAEPCEAKESPEPEL